MFRDWPLNPLCKIRIFKGQWNDKWSYVYLDPYRGMQAVTCSSWEDAMENAVSTADWLREGAPMRNVL